MTEAEAKAALKTRGYRATSKEEKIINDDNSYNPIITEVVIVGCKGTASPSFSSKTKRLEQVNLSFSSVQFPDAILQSLSVKYGKPIEPLSCRMITCSATWKGPNQGIEAMVLRSTDKGTSLVLIRYFPQAPASDL